MDILMAALGATCGMVIGVGLVWCIDRFSEWLSIKIEEKRKIKKRG
jgi:hypothetical protein